MKPDAVTWAGALERCGQSLAKAADLMERRRRAEAYLELKNAHANLIRAVELIKADDAAEREREAARRTIQYRRPLPFGVKL